MKRLRLVIIIVFITNSFFSIGQDNLISFNLGYGKTTDDLLPVFVSPFQVDNSRFIGLGLGSYSAESGHAFRSKADTFLEN